MTHTLTNQSTDDDVTASADGAPLVHASTVRWTCGVAAIALLAAVLLNYRIWLDPADWTVGAHDHYTDQVQSMWFLKWLPWQLFHGHNPFPTAAFDRPSGVDLSWNTSTPTLAVLFAPLTALAGPAVTYDVLMTLAPALTAATSFLWLRRHVRRPGAAALGAGLVAFSPFMSAHLQGHLHMAFTGLLPLALLLTEDLLWRHPRPDRRTAAYLGVVVAAQLGISEESLVIVVLGVCVALIAYATVDARALARALRAAAAPLGLAAAVALMLSAPLLIEQFVVVGHVSMDNNAWRAGYAEYLTPSHNLLMGGPSIGRQRFSQGEQGVFVGWLLVVVLIAGVVAFRRHRSTRVAALTLTVLVLLTFGDARLWGVPPPWHYLGGLPGLAAVLPVRIGLVSWFAVALLIAWWVDALASRLRAPGRGIAAAPAVALVALAAALCPLLPASIHATRLPATPAFFTATHRELPRGTAIVVLPAANPFDASAMYWQQRADFRFDMLGGYAYGKGGDLWPEPTPLVRVAELRTTAPPVVADARAELTREHYRAIVVVQGLKNTASLMTVARLLTGRAPDRMTQGVALWLLA